MSINLSRGKAVAGGIIMNTEQRIISGARVTFDRRKTGEVDATRSTTNRKRAGAMQRKIDKIEEEI